MYQAGIYCRISIEEQNKEGEYSNSIHSQIQMARDYIAEQNNIDVYKRQDEHLLHERKRYSILLQQP